MWRSREEDSQEFLRSYTETYLKEEIAAEGLVRNIGPFAQFLDIAAANDGETVNFNNIARECSVSVKTAKEYYQILEDTFLAFRLPAWTKSARRRLVSHPRYYFFDTGVTNTLAHTLTDQLNPKIFGHRFEQFVICQLMASIYYKRLDCQLYYWRTNHGAEGGFTSLPGPFADIKKIKILLRFLYDCHMILFKGPSDKIYVI